MMRDLLEFIRVLVVAGCVALIGLCLQVWNLRRKSTDLHTGQVPAWGVASWIFALIYIILSLMDEEWGSPRATWRLPLATGVVVVGGLGLRVALGLDRWGKKE